jgi:hypothetical protein
MKKIVTIYINSRDSQLNIKYCISIVIYDELNGLAKHKKLILIFLNDLIQFFSNPDLTL